MPDFAEERARDLVADERVASVAHEGLAGALYRPPPAARRGVAVVLCGPAGREARSAYRPLHLWAQRLSERGLTVLRYDHPGEGDSLSLPPGADQWRAWRRGLVSAAALARRHSGAAELVVCGLRIGATLALETAAEVQPQGLMLISPVASGESWLRDLRLACIVHAAPPTADGSLQVDGLRLSPATLQALEQAGPPAPPVTWRAAWLAAPPSARGVAERLGPAVTVRGFEGHAAFLKEPHVNEPPWPTFAAASAWLDGFAKAAPPGHLAAPLPAPEFRGDGWREAPVELGAGLRGVLTEPTGRRKPRAIIVGNTAADPRAGVGGFAARAARALAGEGWAVLRLDFAGLGESKTPDDQWRTHVYETSRIGDFKAACAVLQARGYDCVSLLGVCTGGFHAVEAVLSGEFDHAIAINSWLIWRPDSMPLERRSELARAEAAAVAPSGWPIARKLAAVRRRLRVLRASRAPDLDCQRIRGRLRAAGSRGAQIDLVFGRGDVAMRWMEADFGPNGAWLARQPGVNLTVRSGLDHALFSDVSQRKALEAICRLMKRAPRRSPRPAVIAAAAALASALDRRCGAV